MLVVGPGMVGAEPFKFNGSLEIYSLSGIKN